VKPNLDIDAMLREGISNVIKVIARKDQINKNPFAISFFLSLNEDQTTLFNSEFIEHGD